MGLKKYEIITVGSDKRVRALRSWAVGDRYVNIGDVGGIVYDEKTLSQDGACWLFRGNFGFPGARIGGDSIVDLGEATLSATGAPNVDILGSSVVVGSKLRFDSIRTSADAVVLAAADFEQGGYGTIISGNPLTKVDSTQYVRPKNLFFAGGKPVALKCEVPGYLVTAVAVDRDGVIKGNSPATSSGDGVSVTVPAGQYFTFIISKDPAAAITPVEAALAQIAFTGTYETKLSIIDSRVEVNPANSTGTLSLRSGGTHSFGSGGKYPEAVIGNSTVSMVVPAVTSRSFNILGQIIGSTATLDGTTGDVSVMGQYRNVKNLTVSGALSSDLRASAYNIIQATNCDNFTVSPTVFPRLADAQTANMPFVFQGCNVPNGIFYHHAQIANTYKNIDFALAQAGLGKQLGPTTQVVLVSSEQTGMYRVYRKDTKLWGALVESYDSVSALRFAADSPDSSYNTTIYKDAYINGWFDIAGTNVFGNKVRSHPLAQVLDVQPHAVQGGFTLTVGLPPVPNTESVRVRTEKYFRLNGAGGIGVQNIPAGVEGRLVYLDGSGNYAGLGDWYTGSVVVPTVSLETSYAYLLFRKTGDAAIAPADLAGVTVTVYNGCKIMHTKGAAVPMKGNIRVEDNATLINASVTGSGYFGGNSVASGLPIAGSVFMDDNAKFIKTAGTNAIRNLRITENGSVNLGDVASLGVVHVSDNAVLSPTGIGSEECDLFMSDNASLTSSVTISGVLRMKDDAKVNAGELTTYGDITLCGSYSQSAPRRWVGKRVIDNESAPTYDGNVKTKYDF